MPILKNHRARGVVGCIPSNPPLEFSLSAVGTFGSVLELSSEQAEAAEKLPLSRMGLGVYAAAPASQPTEVAVEPSKDESPTEPPTDSAPQTTAPPRKRARTTEE